jgi:cytochrome c oxidase subunit 3
MTMEHAHESHESKTHMGMPLPNGKLAMWLFLVTEIMFFTALIGTYLLLRNGQPGVRQPWPTPHDVHLEEWIGALNTFVLICSSLSVVLAHWALHTNNTKRAVQYLSVTFALGGVFLGVKAWEYYQKFDHGILPGRIHEKLDDSYWGQRYLRHVKEQLEHIEAEEKDKPGSSHINAKARAKCTELLDDIKAGKVNPKEVNERVLGTRPIKEKNPGKEEMKTKPSTYADLPEKSRPASADLIEGILELDEHAHVSYSSPYGNTWASCYVAMTGFHALHVLGGLVIFGVFLGMAAVGKFGPQSIVSVEVAGLYWHFVDIVWIFLFPLLYLV